MQSIEQRATQCENKLDSLQRIAETLENDQKQNIIFKQELLKELETLRKIMKNDKREVDTVYLKLEETREENELLKKENEKLKYRIEHIIKNCFESDNKQP